MSQNVNLIIKNSKLFIPRPHSTIYKSRNVSKKNIKVLLTKQNETKANKILEQLNNIKFYNNNRSLFHEIQSKSNEYLENLKKTNKKKFKIIKSNFIDYENINDNKNIKQEIRKKGNYIYKNYQQFKYLKLFNENKIKKNKKSLSSIQSAKNILKTSLNNSEIIDTNNKKYINSYFNKYKPCFNLYTVLENKKNEFFYNFLKKRNIPLKKFKMGISPLSKTIEFEGMKLPISFNIKVTTYDKTFKSITKVCRYHKNMNNLLYLKELVKNLNEKYINSSFEEKEKKLIGLIQSFLFKNRIFDKKYYDKNCKKYINNLLEFLLNDFEIDPQIQFKDCVINILENKIDKYNQFKIYPYNNKDYNDKKNNIEIKNTNIFKNIKKIKNLKNNNSLILNIENQNQTLSTQNILNM